MFVRLNLMVLIITILYFIHILINLTDTTFIANKATPNVDIYATKKLQM